MIPLWAAWCAAAAAGLGAFIGTLADRSAGVAGRARTWRLAQRWSPVVVILVVVAIVAHDDAAVSEDELYSAAQQSGAVIDVVNPRNDVAQTMAQDVSVRLHRDIRAGAPYASELDKQGSSTTLVPLAPEGKQSPQVCLQIFDSIVASETDSLTIHRGPCMKSYLPGPGSD